MGCSAKLASSQSSPPAPGSSSRWSPHLFLLSPASMGWQWADMGQTYLKTERCSFQAFFYEATCNMCWAYAPFPALQATALTCVPESPSSFRRLWDGERIWSLNSGNTGGKSQQEGSQGEEKPSTECEGSVTQGCSSCPSPKLCPVYRVLCVFLHSLPLNLRWTEPVGPLAADASSLSCFVLVLFSSNFFPLFCHISKDLLGRVLPASCHVSISVEGWKLFCSRSWTGHAVSKLPSGSAAPQLVAGRVHGWWARREACPLEPPVTTSAPRSRSEDPSRGTVVVGDEKQHGGCFLCLSSFLKPPASKAPLNSRWCHQPAAGQKSTLMD